MLLRVSGAVGTRPTSPSDLVRAATAVSAHLRTKAVVLSCVKAVVGSGQISDLSSSLGEDFCRSAKEIGLQSVELLEVKDFETLKKYDLA